MAEKNIELDSVEIAAAVFGNCDRNIRLLENEFSVTACLLYTSGSGPGGGQRAGEGTAIRWPAREDRGRDRSPNRNRDHSNIPVSYTHLTPCALHSACTCAERVTTMRADSCGVSVAAKARYSRG